MIETFEFPDGGRLPDRCPKGQALSGGRNGLAICRAIMITNLTDYLVVRPVTSRYAPQANTFIDIPPDPISWKTSAGTSWRRLARYAGNAAMLPIKRRSSRRSDADVVWDMFDHWRGRLAKLLGELSKPSPG